VVHSFDILTRNMRNLRNQIADLNARQIAVDFVKESLTFTGEDPRIWLRGVSAQNTTHLMMPSTTSGYFGSPAMVVSR